MKLTRREFLLRGLQLSTLLKWPAFLPSLSLQAQPKKKKAVLIFLNGGWDLLETVDPKPQSTSELELAFPWSDAHRLFGHPSARMGRWCPQLAQFGVTLVRGLSFGTTSHDAGKAYSDTGVLSNDGRTNAASLAAILGSEGESLIPLLQLPGGLTPQSDRGLLQTLSVVRAENLEQYRSLLPANADARALVTQTIAQLEGQLDSLPSSAQTSRSRLLKEALQKSSAHVSSDLRELLQLSERDRSPYQQPLEARFRREDLSLQERHRTFADGLALTEKLLQAGVTDCVVLGMGGFDTHYQQERQLHPLVSTVDTTLARFLNRLEQSGQLEETLVVVQSDFGRTPRLNASSGRDHWIIGGALLAGGGLPKGKVVGGTDENLNALTVNLQTGKPEEEGTQLNPSYILGSVVEAILGRTYRQRRPYLSKIDALQFSP